MLRRSIPGYETLISQLGVLARHYVQPGSNVYDLGCSLGAATLAMASQTTALAAVRFIGVDNSEAMISRCEQRLARHLPAERFELVCDDVCAVRLQPASLMVLNFTLQFVAPAARQALLDNIAQALVPGGALILSEKIKSVDEQEQTLINDLYLEFKRANGYSEMEISQKRSALEKVMIPDTVDRHIERLKSAGFSQVSVWFQSFSFVSILAVK